MNVAALARVTASLVAAILGLSIVASPPARGATLPSGFQDTVVFSGLEEPTSLRFAADGRVFVAEKPGKILVFDDLQDTTPELFADIRTQVYDTGDRGILGLALDPEFTEGRPYVYVLYTYDHLLGDPAPAPKWGEPEHTGDDCEKPEDADVDACPVSGRLVRLTASGNHAVEEGGVPMQKVLLEDWCQQFSSHSIGDLQFDSSGALLASGGDGAGFGSADYGQFGWPEKNQCGDPPAGIGGTMSPPTAEGGALRAQDARTPADPLDPGADPTGLNGSIVRIDPDTGEGLPGNPMHASIDANERRIVAYGLRNPFRFAIDPTTDEVYVDNVGWSLFEEMDRFSPDATPTFNSGWPCYEGPEYAYGSLELDLCEGLYEESGSTAPPFFHYHHTAPVTPEDPCFDPEDPEGEGSAISGIVFYEGGPFPSSYDGGLFFADAVRGCVYVMFSGEDGRPDPLTLVPFMSDAGPYPGIDLEVGPEGALYYVSLFGEGFGPGAIHRIEYFSGNQPPVARLKVDNEWSAGDLNVEFDATESSDADGDPLEYAWDTNEDGDFTDPDPDESTMTRFYTDEDNHTVAVRVFDSHGAQSTDRITVYPRDTPPEVEIVAPVESSPGSGEAALEWHVGQQIDFEGLAEDLESGDLPPTMLDWSSRLYHCPSACHAHPLQAFPSVASGDLIAPDHDYPSRIELTLTAVDSRGLAATRAIQIFPRPVALTIESKPPGLTLTAGQLTKAAPFPLTAIEGSKITLSAPQTAELGGTEYTWTGWSDGGERVHTIEAGDAPAYRAEYASGEEPPGEEEEEEGGEKESPPSGGPAGGSSGPPPFAAIPPSVVRLPQTSIRKHPAKRTGSRRARFAFSADQSGVAFRCKLDGDRYRACGSPRTYKNLRPGKHVFRVIAAGTGGKDPTPARFVWTVL